jgi:hypothetical protein
MVEIEALPEDKATVPSSLETEKEVENKTTPPSDASSSDDEWKKLMGNDLMMKVVRLADATSS